MEESEMYLLESLRKLIHHIMNDNALITATLSQLRKREGIDYTKVTVKPVELKNKLHYQFAYYSANKVTHQNVASEEAESLLIDMFENIFRQAVIFTPDADYQVLISKKYKVSILTKSPTKSKPDLAHNRKKTYILEEGKPVPFLVELGIMNEDGKVFARRYDKFKQINRFLEMVEDVLPHLPEDRPLTIVDFGCGKSYLTFALYHYLAIQSRRTLNVVGLDLKADVIEHCSLLAKKLNYDNLQFLVGDIAEYDELEQVDMVVTLHACDTATDAALEKAVRWGASVILSVPCCQHELFQQVNSPVMEPLLSHGILKERFSALATDAIRAKLLDLMGYKTQLLEFIDMEHTPKNILIRAVTGSAGEREKLWQEYVAFRNFLGAKPYLERACQDLLPAEAPDSK
ncbi:methyltransferase [Paenibacillus campinasensis]|uniref:Methyltransferase n=2 Tax=Paenibacillus TaxID=44249 RepID=A0ABW9T3C9_9BACL|nr:methyltransferase [Paenibacillus campinasensis]